ncbi:BON domain-containing protein [Rhizobium paranaense]|uniref:Osmotically-inducible protein OsmY n=1 Tax=Rhizobium paranaense TaxID=1650438 RepID=A0A7W9D3A8_9HYPH|nr:BON domain-containing protein [Rhizobium paranaense]MBB5575975.1 osmotically-inducible protein OsmY [Rhizobium paranaense]
MSDLKIRRDVLDELEFDPSVDAANIGVSVTNGIVTLSGHVKSYTEKLAAELITQRVKGVRAIAEEIEVRYPGHKAHSDDEIAGRALDVIAWDTSLPDGAIDVQVQRGWVTLSGEVRWNFQRMAAENAVKKLGGVIGVANRLTIQPRPSVSDIKSQIEQAFLRNAELDANAISVCVADNKVVLEGNVHTLNERRVAEQAAWSIPSVTVVENHLHVSVG